MQTEADPATFLAVLFFVPGIPAPAGSKKGFPIRRKNGTLGVAIVDASKRSRPWKDRISAIAATAWPHAPLDQPLSLTLRFVMPRPASHYGSRKGEKYLKNSAPKWHSGTPDTTKLIRAVEDALTGIVWRDDSLIVAQLATKIYGESTGVQIRIAPAPAAEVSGE